MTIGRAWVWVSALAFQCDAQTTLSIADAIREGLSSDARIEASVARVAAAEGRRRQAGLGPNPRLFLQTEDLRPWSNAFSFPNSTEDYGYVSQTIETGGKRARRVDVARSGVRQAEFERQALRRSIQFAISVAYWEASSAASIRDLYQESLQTYERDVVYGRNRVSEGQMAEADLIRTELERDKVRAQVLAAQRDAGTALFNLYRVMARTDFQPVKLASSIERVQEVSVPEVIEVFATRLELKMAREAVTQAQANIRLQRANAVPDPDVLFGYKRNVGLNTLYASVQVPLPLFNRNQGNLDSADAELRAAQADLAATEAYIRAEVQTALAAYESNRRLLDTLPATKARAEETSRLARDAYRLGGIDLLRLLDAERTRIDTEVTYYRTFAQFQQSVVNLFLAAGREVNSGADH